MGDCSPDTGRKSNVHKTFRKRPGCPLNTFKFIKFTSYFQGGCAEETISETQSELNIHFCVCIISRPTLHSLAQSFSGNCRDSRESMCFTVKYLILKDIHWLISWILAWWFVKPPCFHLLSLRFLDHGISLIIIWYFQDTETCYWRVRPWMLLNFTEVIWLLLWPVTSIRTKE